MDREYKNPILKGLIRKIGKGGYGDVYTICKSRKLQAIKITNFFDIIDYRTENIIFSGLEGTIREVNISTMLKNSLFINNVNTVIFNSEISELSDLMNTDLSYLIEMNNKVRKKSLNGLIQSSVVPDPVKFAYYLLSGLNDIHNIGFVHNDVKPGNILYYTRRGESMLNMCFRLTDMGISYAIGYTQDTIKDSTFMYKSPNYIRYNEGGFVKDLWALGKILYIIIYGGGDQTFMENLDYYGLKEDKANIIEENVLIEVEKIRNFENDEYGLNHMIISMLLEEEIDTSEYLSDPIFEPYRDEGCNVNSTRCKSKKLDSKISKDENLVIIDINFTVNEDLIFMIESDKINNMLNIIGNEYPDILKYKTNELLSRYVLKSGIDTNLLSDTELQSLVLSTYHIILCLVEPLIKYLYPDDYLDKLGVKVTEEIKLINKQQMINLFSVLEGHFWV